MVDHKEYIIYSRFSLARIFSSAPVVPEINFCNIRGLRVSGHLVVPLRQLGGVVIGEACEPCLHKDLRLNCRSW